MTPLLVFRRAAIAEAVTWALLLFGMFLKHVTHTTELGVRVFGMLHGIVFIGFCLVTLVVAVDQKWSRGRLLLGLASSVPPFATIAFDRYAEHRGMLDDHWHTLPETNETIAERLVCRLLGYFGLTASSVPEAHS